MGIDNATWNVPQMLCKYLGGRLGHFMGNFALRFGRVSAWALTA